MKLKIVGRQMDVPKDFNELADKKLSKYDKFFKDDAIAHVTLRKRKNGKEILEVTITSSGMMQMPNPLATMMIVERSSTTW